MKDDIKRVATSDFRANGARYAMLGAVLGLIHHAEQGDLDATDPIPGQSSDPIHKIVSQPDIWELRWKIRGNPYRLYYAEDISEKPEFVGLSFVRKSTNGTSEEIRQWQNQDAAQAQERYRHAQPFQWGHTTKRKRCEYCFGDSISDLL
ncbi:type II toxin-antitoxin system RelE/ParE family toxin [Bifidobacterium oedipodis]|uniref:type II toxin-antitoxin system RelE/ParE family toxin n=1 Tax=Bifidobacterium oedipodis TaxID=2675322 RepID=UPI00145E849D